MGQLAELVWLYIAGNRLTRLPGEIGRLHKLGFLDLDGNRLTELPVQIGQLTKLSELRLGGNQLAQLPPEAHGIVDRTIGLRENPLREPLGTLYADHPSYVPTFLQSLLGAAPRYEAKALLVGEGNVGKTSLVAALLGKPFIVDRPTTHGIQLETLSLPHPRLDAEMLLNTWDFGGQVVYRITHQFFFSRHALYLLVWRPREGHEENGRSSTSAIACRTTPPRAWWVSSFPTSGPRCRGTPMPSNVACGRSPWCAKCPRQLLAWSSGCARDTTRSGTPAFPRSRLDDHARSSPRAVRGIEAAERCGLTVVDARR